jgi:hypothetical protein
MNTRITTICLALCVTLLTSATVLHADTRVVVHDVNEHDSFVIDHRWHHDRYYPPAGYVVRTLPAAAYTVRWHSSPYYFHEGVWYRPYHSHFVVAAAPVGLFVPTLPPFYTRIWVGGAPYFYANDTYYVWRPERRGYVVVDPPPEDQVVTTAPDSSDIYIYPKDGQSPQQEATDRYECNRWAEGETGFDPTRPAGGVPADASASRRTEYQRAMTACLDGRGYSVS